MSSMSLGAKGGIGFAYEFGGEVVDRFSMEERMTLCNLAIEAGARCGYVNPDETTYDYLRGRDHAPRGAAWDRAVNAWQQCPLRPSDAAYDDVVVLHGEAIEPMVTWGISPDQSVPVRPGPDPANARCGSDGAMTCELHGLRSRPADHRHAHRRRLHRVLHQWPPVGFRGGRSVASRPWVARRAACAGAGGARITACA